MVLVGVDGCAGCGVEMGFSGFDFTAGKMGCRFCGTKRVDESGIRKFVEDAFFDFVRNILSAQ